ncbi:MAG: OmpW family protein [Burkholderiales bacterium]|nr:OmpW family protein [Burkholderiales bacterium]
MRKSLIAVATLAALAAPQFAAAQDSGNWIVRARAVKLNSANTNDSTLKGTLDAVTVLANPTAEINDKWIPEVDITYFFTPNFAAELILTYPQKQTLYAVSNGTRVAAIGEFKHLPPTLTAQYHFTGMGALRPYVGVGLNYTNISDVHITIPAAATVAGADIPLNLKRNSYGLAAQLGADYALGGGWLLNVDVKKVQIKTDVLVGAAKVGTFKVDPLLVSLGVGMRF